MDVSRNHVDSVFNFIHFHILEWNKIFESCEPLFNELRILTSKLECLGNVINCQLVTLFPDLKDRLENLISAEINQKLSELRGKWDKLSEANQKLKNSCDVIQKSYSDKRREWEGNASFFQEDLKPSISSTLEWMEDVYLYYSNRLFLMKHGIELYDYNSKSLASLSVVFTTKNPGLPIRHTMSIISHTLETDK